MKRVLWLTVLALALPLTAFADSVDFTNSGGILAGCSDGLSLTGSALIAVKGLNGLAEVRHGIVVKPAKSFGISSSGREVCTTFCS